MPHRSGTTTAHPHSCVGNRALPEDWKPVFVLGSTSTTYCAHSTQMDTPFTDCLYQTHTTHKKELESLLTLNFQTFKKCEFVSI